MGTIKTTNIQSITGSGTVTLGQSGETITVPSGATINLSNATQTGVGGVMTPAFQVNLSSAQTISDNTHTKIQFDREVFDTDNAFDNSTNYRFTVPSGEAGKYFFYFNVLASSASVSDTEQVFASIWVNGDDRAEMCGADFRSNPGNKATVNATLILDLSASDYVEAYARVNAISSAVKVNTGGTSRPDETSFGGFKLIGV